MKKYFRFPYLILIFIIFFSLFNKSLFARDSTRVSFLLQNKKNLFTSISFGMGVDYSNNPSLKKFIQYTIPQYNTLSPSDQLSDFASGLEFFGGVERQISKNFSIKAEYSYFLKSYNVSVFPLYDFSYVNQQPYLIFNYIIPHDFFYIKMGAGAGYILSKLTVKQFGGEKSYTSSGLGLKIESVLNAQISKSVATYLSAYIYNTMLQNLKDSGGNELVSSNGDKVNLNSFGIGLRLGVEVYIF